MSVRTMWARAWLLLALAILTGIPMTLASPPASAVTLPLSGLAERLRETSHLPEGARQGQLLGVPITDAARVFAVVSPWQPLPSGFVPPDLVRLGSIPRVLGQPVSAVLLPDLSSMVEEAQQAGVDLVVLSAYRSFADQQVIFEQNVQRTMYRVGLPLSRGDAERATERFSARPGHSQHQLGTAIDFTTPEMSYSLGQRFAETRTGEWLYANAWRFGFVFPYTDAGEARSGYRNEPWHVRWVGRELASIMHADSYLTASFPIADDYVVAAMELVMQLDPDLARLGQQSRAAQ